MTRRADGLVVRCPGGYTERAMRGDKKRSPILLVSARWQTRALLAAQIGEMTDRDIISVPGVESALKLIKLHGLDPGLIVVDTGQEIAAADVERLAEAKRDVPLVLVLSRLHRAAFEDLRSHCAATLVRPISIGAIARTVTEVLGETGS